jgi:hypothetical protein
MEQESDQVSGLIHVVWPLTSICIQILSENTRPVSPTKTQYIMATGKQALELLHSAASVIPVPLLQDVIRVAIKVIETCEVREFLHGQATRRFTYDYVYQEVSAVQQKVKELQNRVGHIIIVIVNNVTVEYEEDSEVVVKAVGDIQKDVQDLLRRASYTFMVNLLSML